MLSINAFSVSNIKGTKHNLSMLNGAVGNGEEDEMCVYCHTPNAPRSDFSGALKWNKSPKTKSFVMYGTDRAEDNVSIGNNPSLACLGCHDGISAINVVPKISESGRTAAGTLQLTSAAFSSSLAIPGTGKENNHPISVPYREGVAGLKSPGESLNGWSGAKNIDDLLRNNKIECGSCHDPHEATNGTFLRVSNRNSSVCLGCHSK